MVGTPGMGGEGGALAELDPKDLSLTHILLFVAVSWRRIFLDGDSFHRAFYCAACPADLNQGCFLGNQYCAARRLVADSTEQRWGFMVCRG